MCTDDDSDADLVTDYLDALPTTTTVAAAGPPLTANSTLALLDKSVPQVASNIKTYFVSTVDISKRNLMSKSNGSSSDLGIDVGNGSCGQQQQQTNNHSNLNNNNTITITTSTGHNNNNNNNNNINIINNNNHHINNNNNSINMVPIISVTPHSPGAKYNSILEDSLNHLQSIRETVCQMKNSSTQNTTFGTIGIINPTVSSIIFRS